MKNNRFETLEELTELAEDIQSLQNQVDSLTDSITRWGANLPDLDKKWSRQRRRLMSLRDQLNSEFLSVKSSLR